MASRGNELTTGGEGDAGGGRLDSAAKLLQGFRGGKPRGWMAFGALLLLLGYLWNCFYTVRPGYVGIVFAKFGAAPKVEGRFIVEKGEKGYWREPLLPGIHFFFAAEPAWKYTITEERMVVIPSEQVGVVEAQDGEPMQPGQILSKDDYVDEKGVFHMGQRGPRESVMKPGQYPVNPRYLKVRNVPAVIIPEGKVGVVIKRVGDEPPPWLILVSKESSYRGIQKEVQPPGVYYYNPLSVKVEIVDAVVIKKGQIGIVTKKVGKNPPSGTILVKADDDFQGIQEEVLQPGMYYINPYDKDVRIVDAVNIPDGHVGVQIAKTGKLKPENQLLAQPGERGILEDPLPPGLYYLNPFQYDVVVFDTRQQKYEMTHLSDQGDTPGDDSIAFLSDDGFLIRFDLTVIYQVQTHDAPYVVATVGRDVKAVREIEIRPSARSYARIFGSMQRGEDFVHGGTREKFQDNLQKAMKSKGAENRIQILQAQVQHFEVPQELRDPITRKVIANKLQEQYEQEQKTQIANAELTRQKELVNFQQEKIKSETLKVKATIDAEQKRDVEETLKAKKVFEAEGNASALRIAAEASLFQSQKEAEGTLARKLAEAEGQKKMVDAWSGSGAERLVAFELAKVLKGAKILPLETLFGGGGKSGDGSGGPIRYHNTIDLLNYFKLNELTEQTNRADEAVKPPAKK